MALSAGTQLGTYEIVGPLGRGGMGEVYRARDGKLGREVAIKVLPEEFASDPQRLERFDREARMLAALNHPGIAGIHGLEESDGTRFLVLELVEGETLTDRLKRGAIPPEEALNLALQVAEALQVAHDKGILHRDLKPANIMITPDGRVKVLDFGLAKAFGPNEADVNLSHSPTLSMQATRQGVILGTAAYMSPEQARGETTDRRTDIWALGCVLFEMLSGSQVWEGRTVTDVIAALVAREPNWDRLPRNLHPRSRFLLEHCLDKEEKSRCQSMAEVRAEIQKALADPAGLLIEPSTQAETAGWRSVAAWVAALLVAILVTGLLVWNLKPEAPRPVRRFAQSWPADLGARSPGRPVLAVAASGTRFAYNTIGGMYVRDLDELEPRLIPGTETAALSNPFFSPDGEWLGYFSGPDSELQQISVNGGAAIPIAGASNPYGADWGADGTILYAGNEGILRVPATGGEPTVVIPTGDAEQAYGPQLLPGGEWVLFTLGSSGSGWDEADVVAESLSSHERRVLVEGGTDARYVPTGHLVYAFGNALWAVPFDPASLEVSRGGVQLADGLAMAGITGAANYGVSDDGTLVQIYVPPAAGAATEASTLVYARSDGIGETIDLPMAFYTHPRVSPDGTIITFQTTAEGGRSEVWVWDRDGRSAPRQLTQGGNSSRPIWSADSQYVTFMSTRDGSPSIWWQRADLTEEAVQLTHSDGPEEQPDAWSPDGTTLAFTRFAGNQEQSIWLLKPSESDDPVEYVEGVSGGAAFSPDGRWITYRAARNPEDLLDVQIYVKPFPGGGPERVVSQNGGAYPIFSADGKALIYRRPSPAAGGGAPELVSIEISTEGVVRYGTERILPISGVPARFGYRDYDVVPDDDRLVLMRAGAAGDAGTPPPEFRIVLNFFEYLKERVPLP